MIARLLSILISFGLILLPLPKKAVAAVTAVGRTVAVLQVYREQPDPQLTILRDKIIMFLKNRGDITVLADGGDYNINNNATGPATGNTLYEKAKAQFINFQFNESLSTVSQAIELFKVNPGQEGMIAKALLLKTGILWELKDDAGALQAAMDAASYNLDLKALDDYYYSTKMINFYKDAYTKFKSEFSGTRMTIDLTNASTAPIFVNGFMRGTGPTLNIEVPLNMTQIIQVGNSTYSYTPTSSKVSKNYYRIDTTGYQAGHFSTVSDTNFSYLASNAQSMGQSNGANQVAHVKIRKSGGKEEMLLKVVDTKSGFATETRYYLIKKFEDDSDKIAKMASDYIASLTSPQYFMQSYSYSWDLNESDGSTSSYLKKPKKLNGAMAADGGKVHKPISTKTILIIVGAVLAAGGIAAGIALSSGGGGGSTTSTGGGGSTGGGSETTSTTILTGPAP